MKHTRSTGSSCPHVITLKHLFASSFGISTYNQHHKTNLQCLRSVLNCSTTSAAVFNTPSSHGDDDAHIWSACIIQLASLPVSYDLLALQCTLCVAHRCDLINIIKNNNIAADTVICVYELYSTVSVLPTCLQCCLGCTVRSRDRPQVSHVQYTD